VLLFGLAVVPLLFCFLSVAVVVVLVVVVELVLVVVCLLYIFSFFSATILLYSSSPNLALSLALWARFRSAADLAMVAYKKYINFKT
jgi:hypothetical protein